MDFTKNATKTFDIAKELAVKSQSENFGTEHLMLGLLMSEDEILMKVLEHFQLDVGGVVDILESTISVSKTNTKVTKRKVKQTPRCSKILDTAKGIAQKLGEENVEVIHIFMSMLYLNEGVAVSILAENGIHFDSVRELVVSETTETSIPAVVKNKTILPEEMQPFFTDLVLAAENGELQNKFVRDIDYNDIYLKLATKYNANVLLVGDVGVGQKEVVYEIANRIYKGSAPAELLGKKVLELRVKSLISGTKYRGDFEARIEIVQRFLAANKNIIVFVGDLYHISKLDSNYSSMEQYFVDLFEVSSTDFISICNTDDHKSLEKTQLPNSFKVVKIKEADDKETLDIIRNSLDELKQHHSVEYNKDVPELVLNLSNRYINDKFQPSAAIDLLDECGAYLKIKNTSLSKEDEEIVKTIEDLCKEKDELVAKFKFEEALHVKTKENLCIDKLKTKTRKPKQKTVTSTLVKEYIYKKTGIPVEDIGNGIPDLDKVRAVIDKEYVSHESVVDCVLTHFKRVKAGLQDPKKPLASFLFLGPTGVGKTHLCYIVSREFFHNSNNFIRIDMSEYMNKESISRFIGAPPGYIGHGEKSVLVDFVKQNPYSLVLFDEIEKAHPEVLNIFLQILDNGELTDGMGRKINFRNTIIAFTSNVGSELYNKSSMGFSGDGVVSESEIQNSLKTVFSPEFLNRLDEVTHFGHLKDNDVLKLVDIQVNKFTKKLKEIHKIKFDITKDAKVYIGKHGYSKRYGARFLKRYFEKNIESVVAEKILDKSFKAKKISCKLEKDTLKFS